MNCEHCQTLLLDHLYGLLEGAEAASVDAHLATCPQCAAARAETARVQGLFARAAKSAFPNTKFEPPAPVVAPQKAATRTPAPSEPAGRPVPATQPATRGGKALHRIAAVVPWAVAAAVLLAVPGTVVPVLRVFDRATATRHDAEVAQREAESATRVSARARLEHDSRLSDAEIRFTTAEATQTALLDKWFDEQKAAMQTALARKLTIDVDKPTNVQPGAPNDFRLVVRDERSVAEARSAELVAEVRTSDAVLFTQNINHEKDGPVHAIHLPASVWTKVKPDSELTLVVVQVDGKTKSRTPLQEVRLAGPVFTTLLTTDKPAYRPGERLFFRSLTLDRVTLKPPHREQVLRYDLVHGKGPNGRPVTGLFATGTTELVRVSGGPNGRVEPVRMADGQPVRGVGCGEFVLPDDLADGEYTLVLRELPPPGGFSTTVPLPVTRTVKVRAGAADTYSKLIDFGGASFVSGGTVEAWAELKFQDKPVPGAEVAGATVQVDGVPLLGADVAPRTDTNGRAKVRFTLPDEVLNGDVRLKVAFRAGGHEEVVADRVPVIGRRLTVEFFPECGDTIIAGVPCKVYVRATTPAGQPVDISGVITDGRQTLATVKTLRDAERGANRGLASFTFTPRAGTRTWLKLDAPNSVYAPIMVGAPVHSSAVALMGGPGAVAARTGFELPAAKIDGVVMSVPDTITSPGQPIRVHLYSVGQPRTIVVGAYTRGRLSDTQKVTVESNQLTEVKLMAGADPLNGGRGGVVRVTAFEELDAAKDGQKPDLKPVAERLVFRRPGDLLKLSVAVAPGAALAPGTNVNCAVSATDEKNNPVAAVLWASVVNTGVAPGAKDRTMPTHFLLAGDVKTPDELEYADFLLSDHEHAGEALDLVLGTQGWRRFAEQPKTFGAERRPYAANAELARFMVQNGQAVVQAEPTAAREYRKIAETYAPLYETAVQAVARARVAREATREAAHDVHTLKEAESAVEAAARVVEEKRQRAEDAREPVRQFRSAVWYGFAGFAALAVLCGSVSVARPKTRLPLGASTLGSFALAAFLFVAAGWSDEARANGSAELSKDAPPGRRVMPAEPLEQPQPPGPAGADGRSGAVAVTDPPRTNSFAVKKSDGPEKSAMGGATYTFGGAGFGGAPGHTVPPRGAGGFGKESFPPAYAKSGMVPSGPPLPVPHLDGKPEMKLTSPAHPVAPPFPAPAALPAPGALGAGGGVGGGGWVPNHSNGVADADLSKNGPSAFRYSFFGTRQSLREERVDALKRVTDTVTQYANERQRALAGPVNSHLAARGIPQAPGPELVGPPAVTGAGLPPAKVELLALQQVRDTVAPLPPLVVREYAAPRPAPAGPDATDTPDTILWQPIIVLPADGKTVVQFALGGARGGYRVVVAGHTGDGRLGEARALIVVSAPATDAPTSQAAPIAPPAPGARPAP